MLHHFMVNSTAYAVPLKVLALDEYIIYMQGSHKGSITHEIKTNQVWNKVLRCGELVVRIFFLVVG